MHPIIFVNNNNNNNNNNKSFFLLAQLNDLATEQNNIFLRLINMNEYYIFEFMGMTSCIRSLLMSKEKTLDRRIKTLSLDSSFLSCIFSNPE